MKNSIESMPWGSFDGEEVRLWRLVNANGLELQFTNYGGRLVKAIVPDRNGHFENVTLGWPTLDEYVAENGGTYYGALVGRYGNRIGAGKFTLNGKEYTLELNNEPAGPRLCASQLDRHRGNPRRGQGGPRSGNQVS